MSKDERCGYNPPKPHNLLMDQYDDFMSEGCGCQLKVAHGGEHIILSKKGRCFTYEPQYSCDPIENCECDISIDYDSWDVCGVYSEITKEEAEEAIKKAWE